MTRGVAPVATSTTSVSSSSVPSDVSRRTVVGDVSTPLPATTLTPTSVRRLEMSALWAAASASTRRLTSPSSATASATSSPSASSRWTPRSAAVSNSLM